MHPIHHHYRKSYSCVLNSRLRYELQEIEEEIVILFHEDSGEKFLIQSAVTIIILPGNEILFFKFSEKTWKELAHSLYIIVLGERQMNIC